MGDGCNMEGISSEAASLAGHWGLGKLIAFYDDNRISIDGHTEISFTEDVCARYEAMGWHVQHVQDGNHDLDGLRKAIAAAKVRAAACSATDESGRRLLRTLRGSWLPLLGWCWADGRSQGSSSSGGGQLAGRCQSAAALPCAACAATRLPPRPAPPHPF